MGAGRAGTAGISDFFSTDECLPALAKLTDIDQSGRVRPRSGPYVKSAFLGVSTRREFTRPVRIKCLRGIGGLPGYLAQDLAVSVDMIFHPISQPLSVFHPLNIAGRVLTRAHGLTQSSWVKTPVFASVE